MIDEKKLESINILDITEQQLEELIQAYRELKKENERLRKQLKILAEEIDAVLAGDVSQDWAEHYGPLFDMVWEAKKQALEGGQDE